MSVQWAETIAVDEKARFEGFAGEMRALQKRNAKGGVSARTLHVKAHVGAVGQLLVNADVDARFRMGAFAEPSRAWPVYVRFSNGASRKQTDKTPDVRGLAVKLVGVPGKKIIPGLEDKVTQDFLLIPTPAIPFRTPDEFLAFVRASSTSKSPLSLLGKIFGTFGLGRGLQVIRRLGQTPKVTSMVTQRFYTAAPIRMGDAAAKLALFPIPGGARGALPASPSEGKHGLREDLVHALGAMQIEYSVRAQPFIDEASTPIEDASVVWPEANNPYVEIARLVLPKQDVTSTRGQEVEALVEKLSFDPWHALEAHRPLGAIMRARAVAYRDSVIERGAAPEPDSVLTPG